MVVPTLRRVSISRSVSRLEVCPISLAIDRLLTSSMNTSRSFPKTLTRVTLLNGGGTDVGNFLISIGLHAMFFPYQVCF